MVIILVQVLNDQLSQLRGAALFWTRKQSEPGKSLLNHERSLVIWDQSHFQPGLLTGHF